VTTGFFLLSSFFCGNDRGFQALFRLFAATTGFFLLSSFFYGDDRLSGSVQTFCGDDMLSGSFQVFLVRGRSLFS
jgi:hypothetical protein